VMADFKLRECPFCGNEPSIITIEPHRHAGGIGDFMPDHPGSAYIDCACGVGIIDSNAETVATRWNRRIGDRRERMQGEG
jgi:hypothetical protein